MNAFADWLDNDAHFYLLLGSLIVVGALLIWTARHFRSEPPSFSYDEMAVARAAEFDHFAMWEAECSKLQRLADKLGSRS